MLTPRAATISVADFMAKWGQTDFGERQAAQPFFDDICRLVGHPTTSEAQDPENFTFESGCPAASPMCTCTTTSDGNSRAETPSCPGLFNSS